MKRQAITFLCIMLSSSSLLIAQTNSNATVREVRAANGSRAVVLAAGKSGMLLHDESRIDVYTAKSDKVCSLDLSADDGEQGYSVAKAAWTADGNYLVYSLQSSGGHAPWHTPTLFVSITPMREVCLLDSYLNKPGVSMADFKLTAPDLVTTRVYGANSDVTVSLSRITQSPVNGRSRCVPCEMAIPVKFLP